MTYTLGSLREDFLKQLKKELEWSKWAREHREYQKEQIRINNIKEQYGK